MLASVIIAKKRDQRELSADEIRFMIDGYGSGAVPDYQMAAWAMAILCRGMTDRETASLTDAMLASGQRLKRASDRPRVDKHSTGGLGDKTSLILAPLVACFEVDVPMLSGRGLGITGGTLDKLESYTGFNCQLSSPQINRQLQQIGCVITGTTPEIAPADRQLYALRDVTGTVPSISLITSSIMSKKLAESLDALVLDVKFGSGAFMSDIEAARQLADSLQATGQRMQVSTRVLLSDMNQPLGRMVGNACEANEAVQILQGGKLADPALVGVRELTVRLSAELLVAAGQFPSLDVASRELHKALDDGRALSRFEAMLNAQGATLCQQLPLAEVHCVLSPRAGWLQSWDGQQIGQAVIELGGGRSRQGQPIDHAVGLEVLARIGTPIERQQPLVNIFARTVAAAEQAQRTLLQAVQIGPEPPPQRSLFAEFH